MKIGDLVQLSETACIYGCLDLDNPVYGIIIDSVNHHSIPGIVYDVHVADRIRSATTWASEGDFYYECDLTVISAV